MDGCMDASEYSLICVLNYYVTSELVSLVKLSNSSSNNIIEFLYTAQKLQEAAISINNHILSAIDIHTSAVPIKSWGVRRSS